MFNLNTVITAKKNVAETKKIVFPPKLVFNHSEEKEKTFSIYKTSLRSVVLGWIGKGTSVMDYQPSDTASGLGKVQIWGKLRNLGFGNCFQGSSFPLLKLPPC